MSTSSDQPHALTAQVERVLAAIRPSVQADGGDLELVDITEAGEVRIRLLGACIECPSADMTLKGGIEQNLKALIPEVTSVIAIS
jgi:Fe-S cluster biogenesis protein NfuA